MSKDRGSVVAFNPWHRSSAGVMRTAPQREGSRPAILIIYTGGTLGMKKDEEGSLTPVPGAQCFLWALLTLTATCIAVSQKL
eukprot:8355-Heterococcus_DN1.PRE.3